MAAHCCVLRSCLSSLITNRSGAGCHSAVKVKHGKLAASGIEISSAHSPGSTDTRLHNSPRPRAAARSERATRAVLRSDSEFFRQAARSRMCAVDVSAACRSPGRRLHRQGAAPTFGCWPMAIMRAAVMHLGKRSQHSVAAYANAPQP